MMWGSDGWGWPIWHGFGWLFMLLLIVLIVLGIVVLFRSLAGGPKRGGEEGGGDRAMAILRERYARGEITKEQLDQMTKHLT